MSDLILRISPFSSLSSLPSSSLPAASLRALAHVQSCASRFVSRLSSPEALSDDYLHSHDHDGRFATSYATATEAIPLSAERVALPGNMQSVNLVDLLPPYLAKVWAAPNPDLIVPKAERKPAARAFMVESPQDWVSIVCELKRLGKCTFTTEPVVVNGVFGVTKTDGSIRFVVDGRRANACFVPPPKMELPGPDLLARLQVDPDREFFVAKIDLDNFYHRIRVPEWLQPYFALPPVRAGDVGLGDKYGPDTLVYPCCTTLPMGWSHSAHLAQAVHTHTLDSRTSIKQTDRITKHNDLKIDRTRNMIYIDDFMLLGLDRAEMAALQDEYWRVFDEAGLPPKPSKLVRPCSDGVDLIGVELHGRLHTCGVRPDKIQRLVERTGALLRRGVATGVEMSRIVGYWTWTCMSRRCSFSVFSSVYRFIECAGRRLFTIWPSVHRELRVVMGLAPLLFTQMDAPWFPHVLATDASDSGLGVVATTPAASVDLEAMAALPKPVLHVEDEPLDRKLHPTLVGARWREIVSAPWRWAEHINVLEARALDTAVRWAIKSPRAVGSRLISWCDSMVVMFAVRKGRSSAFGLLRQLRRLSASMLASGIQLHCNWIATEVNPADDPSRRWEGFKFDSTKGFPGEGPDFHRSRLRDAAVEPSTRGRYGSAVSAFFSWVRREGRSFSSLREFDGLVVAYLDHLYESREGSGRSYGEQTVNGLVFFRPALKPHLHGSRQALRGWKRLSPSVAHPPLTWELAVLIAVTLARRGRPNIALAVVLSFDAYLRAGELARLRFRDVVDGEDARVGSAHKNLITLRLGKTKTGDNQCAEVRDPAVRTLLRSYLAQPGRRRRSKAKLFGFSVSTYRRHFNRARDDLGLSSDYVLHSLRHGGATRDHMAGVPLEEILRRGRWASTKSARHYIQSGVALAACCTVPAELGRLAANFARNLVESFALAQKH